MVVGITWNNITVLKSEFAINISGSLDWTSIQSIQIRIDPSVGNIGNFNSYRFYIYWRF